MKLRKLNELMHGKVLTKSESVHNLISTSDISLPKLKETFLKYLNLEKDPNYYYQISALADGKFYVKAVNHNHSDTDINTWLSQIKKSSYISSLNLPALDLVDVIANEAFKKIHPTGQYHSNAYTHTIYSDIKKDSHYLDFSFSSSLKYIQPEKSPYLAEVGETVTLPITLNGMLHWYVEKKIDY